MKTKIVAGIILVVVIVLAYRSFNNKGSTQENNTIKIGAVLPLTGDASSYGVESKNSIQLAVDEINANGGMDGQNIEVIFEDGKCGGKDATSAAQKLITIDKVNMIVGGLCSGEALAIAPIAEKANILHFSGGASSPELTGVSKVFFRNAPSDSGTGKKIAELANTNNHKKIAIISENSDYSQALRKVFTKNHTGKGGVVVYDETFNPDTKDFRSFITKIKNANPDAIFINPQTDIGASILVKQIREAGITAQIYANVFPGTKVFLEKSSSYAEGIFFTDAPGLDSANKKSTDFESNYKKKYNSGSNYLFYTGAAYDDIYIMKQAVEKVGTDTDKLVKYLRNLKDYSGVISNSYGFDENGDLFGVDYKVKTIKNGQVVEIK